MLKKMIGLMSVLCFAVVLPVTADVKVRCDSTDGRYHECVAGYADSVTVARQWSKSKCVRGDNWGYRDGMIWVDEGCRADFNVVPSGMTSSSGSSAGNRSMNRTSRPMKQTVICESTDGHRRHCAVDTSGGVRITKRLSKNACEYRDDWGWDSNGVWVAHGCRAEFEVKSENGLVSQSMNDEVLVCESENGRRKHCPANTRFGVAVFRQLSDSECIMNRTWGYDSRGVWVTSGCRAEFLLNPR
jgi:hypothetical protein